MKNINFMKRKNVYNWENTFIFQKMFNISTEYVYCINGS